MKKPRCNSFGLVFSLTKHTYALVERYRCDHVTTADRVSQNWLEDEARYHDVTLRKTKVSFYFRTVK